MTLLASRIGTRTDAPAALEIEPSRRRRSPPAWLLALLFIAGATALQLIRQAGTPSFDSMYAEDGRRWIQDALADNSLSTILEPYAGYLHTLPRLLGALAAELPIAWAAPIMAVLSALIVSLLALYVYDATSDWVKSRWGRALIAVSMIMLPAVAFQSLANATNLHYFLFFACFWAVLRPRQTGARRVCDFAVMLATTLSSSFVLLLAPIALYRLFLHTVRGSRSSAPADVVVLLVFLCGVVVQLATVLGESAEIRERPVVVPALAAIYGLRVIGSVFLGERVMPLLVESADLHLEGGAGWVLSVATALVVAALGLYVLGRRDLKSRWVLATALVYSVVMFAAPALGRGMEATLPDAGGYRVLLARYFVIPGMLLVAVVIGLLSDRDPRIAPRSWARLHIVALAFLAMATISSLSAWNDRSPGPGWQAQIATARTRCAAGAATVVLQHAPRPYLRRWHVTVPCSRIGVPEPRDVRPVSAAHRR